MCMNYLFFVSAFSWRTRLGYFHQPCVRFLCLLILFHCGFYQLAIALEGRDPYTEKKTLQKYLFHYETLSKSSLSIRVRRQRDAETGQTTVRMNVNFFTLGKNFQIVLKAGSPVLKPGFKAYTVDRHGRHTPLDIDPNNFFTGHLQENISIPVDAHYEDGILCLTVHFPNDTYFTEPSWRHLPGSTEYDLISYRLSDVNWSSVGHLRPPLTVLKPLFSNSTPSVTEQYHTLRKGKQRRQASSVKKKCPLKLVADYVFFSEYAGSVAETAAYTMLNTIYLANKIFEGTRWILPDGLGWGFVVTKLLVHTEYSTGPADGEFTYNYRQEWSWYAKEFLEAFSMSKDIASVCLSHLFTSNIFPHDKGVVGLAYKGNRGRCGGICSWKASFAHLGGPIFPRTSWSTSVNYYGQAFLYATRQLVTAHELGHNWGSPHDPSGTCAPSDEQGGQYLMYQYNTPGLQPNNFRFSKCSIEFISQTLKYASYYCFTVGNSDMVTCGNGIVDIDEECDAGVTGLLGKDQCCTSTCTFQASARCSDLNSPCCRNCSVARAGTICGTTSAIRCLQASQCDGFQLTCPSPQPAANGTLCVDGGICEGGICIPYCKLLGESLKRKYTPCMCTENAVVACMRCCMEVLGDNTNGPCLPTNQSLGVGRQCFNGECDDKGICIPDESSDMITLLTFFNNLDLSTFAETMKGNTVMAIIILSALIWIPASCYISHIDERNLKEQEKRMAAFRAKQEGQNANTDSHHDDVSERSASEGVSQSSSIPEHAV